MDVLYGNQSVYYAISEKGEGICLVCYEKIPLASEDNFTPCLYCDNLIVYTL